MKTIARPDLHCRLVENCSEAEEKNYAPSADLYEMHLANGWQAKENCPDLKPVDASTFGCEKVFPKSGKPNEH